MDRDAACARPRGAGMSCWSPTGIPGCAACSTEHGGWARWRGDLRHLPGASIPEDGVWIGADGAVRRGARTPGRMRRRRCRNPLLRRTAPAATSSFPVSAGARAGASAHHRAARGPALARLLVPRLARPAREADRRGVGLAGRSRPPPPPAAPPGGSRAPRPVRVGRRVLSKPLRTREKDERTYKTWF